ncbi:ATP-dependent DNA ligase [Paenibacillus abyssi]|uniref:SPBc2 prophage-derived DNA ligase-like protein LigB n=1 Tax=Paenibacillus abyssi TaxID=1340531 RepID=A0A917G154_9BACL|nr:ATP-dependent DNA ligase [Paenibacillus abyssi]GGG17641.1 SPBc2 prophage-derived DNA ligase-like protein LigB [Paenibacillus abyssi]
MTFIEPMLLTACNEPDTRSTVIAEPKIDGFRVILSVKAGKTDLWTRHRNLVSKQFPELMNVPVEHDVVLDGEVAYYDPAIDNFCFESISSRILLSNSDKIKATATRFPAVYVIWDILYKDGRDLRALPLLKRKEILHQTVKPNEHFSLISFAEGRGAQMYEEMCARNMEGATYKDADSRYEGRRSPAWRKHVRYETAEVVISGYRRNEFGWFAQIEEDNRLRPAGIIELAVPPGHRKAFYKIAQQLVTGEDENAVYLQPLIRAKVKFRNWTKNRMLRTPAFVDFIY